MGGGDQRETTLDDLTAMSIAELQELMRGLEEQAAAKQRAREEQAAAKALDPDVAQRKELMQKIGAARAELSREEQDTREGAAGGGVDGAAAAAQAKESSSGKRSYRDVDGNVFCVNETKDAAKHLETSQAFRRMMTKERLPFLTNREGMEISVPKLLDALRSNSGHSERIFGEIGCSDTWRDVWGSMKDYHLYKTLPVLQQESLLSSLVKGEWGKTKDSVRLKHFCEGDFNDNNQSHLIATLQHVSEVFYILFGNDWKDFLNPVVHRVRSELAGKFTQVRFMSWIIDEALGVIFIRLREPYNRPHIDLPDHLRLTPNVVMLVKFSLQKISLATETQLYFERQVVPTIVTPEKKQREQRDTKKRERKKPKAKKGSSSRKFDDSSSSSSSSSATPPPGKIPKKDKNKDKEKEKKKIDKFCLVYLAAHYKISEAPRLCQRGDKCRFLHRVPSTEDEKKRAVASVPLVKMPTMTDAIKDALVAKINE